MHVDAVGLRNRLVDTLRRTGAVRSAAVEAAFRTVPRHTFLSHLLPEEVYRDDAIVTRYADGLPSSSSSQPSIMAIMVEQLELQPGHRVLEIGAGTGYNAAILREVVGPAGVVVTIDIQPDVVEEAGRHLGAAGYGDVLVVTGDGGYGHPDRAPYDRIILTASADDISPHWVEQLRDSGLLLLPLRIGTMGLSVAFQKRGDRLVSRTVECCGFMPLQGAYAASESSTRISMGDGLFIGGPGVRGLGMELLRELLSQTPRRVPGVIVPMNGFGLGGGLGVHLALTEPGMVDVYTTQPERWGFHAITGVVDAHAGSLCLVRQDAVVVYGSDAAADRFTRRAAEWVAMGRPGIEALRIEAVPAGTVSGAAGRWTIPGRWYDFQLWVEGASATT